MADESTITEQVIESEDAKPHGEESTDWKAEARKWEKRAKENSDAKAELDAMKAAQMTEIEKAQADLAKAKAEADTLKAQIAHAETVARLSKEYDIPSEILDVISDSESMEHVAKLIKKQYLDQPEQPQVIHSAGIAPSTRIHAKQVAGIANRDAFAAFFDE